MFWTSSNTIFNLSFRHHAVEAMYNWEGVPRSLESIPGRPVHGLHVSERHCCVHAAHVSRAHVRGACAAASPRQVLPRVPPGRGGEGSLCNRQEDLPGTFYSLLFYRGIDRLPVYFFNAILRSDILFLSYQQFAL